MATADELLATISDVSEEILTVDMNARVIVIPATIKVLGVESDDDVKRLHFNMPRHYGEFDLSEFDTRINFQNARGNDDFYLVPDVTTSDSDDTMSFSWLVDRVAFKYKGDVTFSICMKKYDESGVVVKEFNTTVATLPVLKGLETDKAVVEDNPSAFDSVLYRLYAVEAANELGKNGYYTVIKVEENDDGVVFSIVDQDGNTEAIVKHGTNGVDGYTPVKGVDYWTEEDKTEMKSNLKSYIDTWAPVEVEVTLLAESWVDNLQTVTVDGVTTNTTVFIAPEPSDENYDLYTECVVKCKSKADGTLTFTCKEVPSSDLIANVWISNNTMLKE